jgi:acetylornithine deacetylase/succinyl-diaminopimelate desuccinylase-like protein
VDGVLDKNRTPIILTEI